MAGEEDILDLVCDCNRMSVVKTRWWGENAGRRFRECVHDACGYFVWIDLPLGGRVVETIKELQERNAETICKFRRRMERMSEKHEADVVNLRRKQGFMVVVMFIVFSVMMSTALTSVMHDNVIEDYDSDEYV